VVWVDDAVGEDAVCVAPLDPRAPDAPEVRRFGEFAGESPGEPDDEEREQNGLGTQRPDGRAGYGEDESHDIGFQAAHIGLVVEIDGELPMQNTLRLDADERLVAVNEALGMNSQPDT